MKKSISEIYKRYSIPSNLQKHMLRTTSIARLLCEKWTGPTISQKDIITTMLIHDIGNITKIDFSNYEVLTKKNKDITYWRRMKQNFIRKYGTDDHIATFNISSELRLKPRILWLVINKIFIHNEMIAASTDYELKICAYSDQCTGPYGIVSLKDRFDELRERYGTKASASINHPRSKCLVEAAFEIEKQVLEFTSIGPLDIVNQTVSNTMSNLLGYMIETL